MSAEESARSSLTSRELQSFRETIETRCAACGSHNVDLDALVSDTGKRLAEPSGSTIALAATMSCLRCSASTCLGCGETCAEERAAAGHCPRGHLVCAWVLLCAFDQTLLHNNVQERSGRRKKASKKSASGPPSGVGYGGTAGVENGSDEEQYLPPPYPPPGWMPSDSQGAGQTFGGANPPSVPPVAPVIRRDALLATTASTICPLVTHSGHTNMLRNMLTRSSLLDSVAELLKNDSIEDVATRSSVYGAVISITEDLAKQSNTNSLITADRPVNREGQDLYNIPTSEDTPSSEERGATKQAISTCLRNLVTQSGVMLGMAAKASEDFQTKEGKMILSMCRLILELQETIDRTNKGKGATEDGQDPEQADSWQKEHALSDVPDDVILRNHHYENEAYSFNNLAKGRARRLAQDITTLTTSLPPGIFVRHGSSRLDVMKVLIVGPVGTPYENGLFEFDVLCGQNYPEDPPKMWFRTTGGGRARFNPNLYETGHVCLSLLGTWEAGERWDAKKSTLLQLVLSVQAFIFNEEPLCNEPGNEYLHGSPRSTTYNHQLYALTIKHAMIDWLEKDWKQDTELAPSPFGTLTKKAKDVAAENILPASPAKQQRELGIWEQVVGHHFKTNEPTITATLNRWKLEAGQTQKEPAEVDFPGRLKHAQESLFKAFGPVRALHTFDEESDDSDGIE